MADEWDMLRKCLNCDSPFDVPYSRLKHGRGKYCCAPCQYAHQLKVYSERCAIKAVCVGCSIEFSRPQSSMKGTKGAGKYCTRVCRDKYRVKDAVPNWRGGSEKHYTRGSNWSAQRRAALRRDNKTCQVCGSANDPQVHHLIPFRCFDDYREANKLKNLQTLCPSCHRKADAKFQREEL